MLCLMRGRHRAFVSSRGRWTSTGRRAKRELFGAGDQAPGARRRDCQWGASSDKCISGAGDRGQAHVALYPSLSVYPCLSIRYPCIQYPVSSIRRMRVGRLRVGASLRSRSIRGVVVVPQAAACTAPASDPSAVQMAQRSARWWPVCAARPHVPRSRPQRAREEKRIQRRGGSARPKGASSDAEMHPSLSTTQARWTASQLGLGVGSCGRVACGAPGRRGCSGLGGLGGLVIARVW